MLKKSSINELPTQIVETYAISDVVYDWSRMERPTPTPSNLPTLIIDNYSRSRQAGVSFDLFLGLLFLLLCSEPINCAEKYDFYSCV